MKTVETDERGKIVVVIAGVVAQQACVLAFLHGILCQRATNGGKGNAEISLLFFSTSSEDC